MDKRYNQLIKGKRIEFPLATGAASHVSLIYDDKNYPYLLCWTSMTQEYPEFTVPLVGCRIINNITEIGPCIHIITVNEEYQFQCSSKEEYDEMSQFFNILGYRILGFKNVYILNKKIGKGSFSTAYIGTNKIYGNKVVVKEVDKSKVKESNIYTEIEVLRKVVHKYIIKLISAYEQEGYVYLVLEYLKGGELFEYINNNGPYTEQMAKKAIKRVLIALEALHSNGVVHRDLKMENLMLEDINDPTSLKIIDFGLASFLNSPSMSMRCGSPGYVAPEILKHEVYGTKVDIFSLGIILFNVLCGYPPFRGNSVKEVFRKNIKCCISFGTKHWINKSENVKEIILWMCSKNPDNRCTAIQALGHPWFLPKITDMHMLSNVQDLRNKSNITRKIENHKELYKKCKHYNIDMNNNNNDNVMNIDMQNCTHNNINEGKQYFDTMLKLDEKYTGHLGKEKDSVDSISLNQKDYDSYINDSSEFKTVVLHGGCLAQKIA
ncbi:protein kinase 2 [Hepatocystis sp. ex Piliocolobus tephrosceles]|nr:protein kinase 2 [Hepatocystis sp. ex Piliocolobus tephrosceles]